MSKNNLFFSFFLLVMVAIMVIIVTYEKPADRLESIVDFESCSKSGGRIMESYPRQCSLQNGKFFTEQIVETECRTITDCQQDQVCINNNCTNK